MGEEKKKRFFRFELHKRGEHVSYIDDPLKVIRQMAGHGSYADRECRGTAAFSGRVTGVARIIYNTKARPLKNGEILISVSSSPELMPYIRKCAAMVTDEGGLGCHAAIISRELKKPCVIGTKIATQVFKDGDRVEVDAVHGIVKRI
jgi:pyruvate,water dikinase